MLRRYPRWQPGVDKALGLLEKYSTAFILRIRGEITASINTPGDRGWRSLKDLTRNKRIRMG
jgi:hypothetical protein